VSGLRAQFDLVPEAGSARAARRAVAEVLSSWGLPAYAVDDAVLIVSELVANAVLHARDEAALELEITFGGAWLRVSVSDGSAVRPSARAAERNHENGRGMAIIDALSDRWGVEGRGRGKRIWFEVDLGRTPPTAAEQAGDAAWDATDHLVVNQDA
jgi:anti-sigma regulatory factor (Ser/Thr protein kinase)